MNSLYAEIENERQELERLVHEALVNNQPLGTNDEILARSHRLDLLFEKLHNATLNKN